MGFLLQPALAYLLLYKYVALFVITYFGALALPMPSAPSLMAAAAFAAQGYFSLTGVLVVAAAGNIAGDVSGYWLARRYGKPVLNKLGFRKVLESDSYDWIQWEVQRYRFPVVFFSRVNVLSTISVNIIAGLSRMPFAKFLLYDMSGEIVQVLGYGAIGYFFGANWQGIYAVFGNFTLALIAGILLFMTLLSNRVKQRLMRRRDGHIQRRRRNSNR
jgi:membrane-associated protein